MDERIKMKITLDTSTLRNNVRLLSGLVNKDDKNNPLNGRLLLFSEEEILTLIAGTPTSLVVIQQPLLEGESGECCVTFSLIGILKMIRGEEVTLKVEKKMSITDGQGFRSSLSLIDTIPVYDKIKEWKGKLNNNHIILDSGELRDLCKASLEFPDYRESRWIDISVDDTGVIYGSIQENEIGSIDRFPFTGVEGDFEDGFVGTLLSFNPEQLLKQLTFCSDHVKLSLGEVKKIPTCITDPLNDAWYGLLSQIVKPYKDQNDNTV
jgi:hypothetical protein